jgi:hypothetical protein
LELSGGAIRGTSLERLSALAADVEAIRYSDLEPGDWVLVRTRNSTYTLRVNADGTFDATGGWFLADPDAGSGVRVVGCTWGGSAILTGMIATPGMYLEFSNRVRTTRIRDVRLLRNVVSRTLH